jgi:formylglycine-generating enzyme required for sulfatase activity
VCSEPLTQLSSFHQSGKANYPLTGVDAWQAATFCTWIGRRLPTLAEWQLIVTPGRLPWGDDGPTPDQANLCFDCSDSPIVIHEVGSFPSGAIGGINDIIGNVSEWTTTELDMSMRPIGDWSGKDPQTMPSQVAIVGGSAWSNPYEQLYMNRTSGSPDEDIGFRCVEP